MARHSARSQQDCLLLSFGMTSVDRRARVTNHLEELAPSIAAEGSGPYRNDRSEPQLVSLAQTLLAQLALPALAQRVQVEWSTRLKSTAGNASRQHARIRLNPQLREFGTEEIERTLRHELAHLVAWERAGWRRIAAHGREWRAACADLGITDEKRCHTLPFAGRTRQKKRFLYRCPHCTASIPRVRPFKRRTACLPCCRAHNRGRYDDRFRLVKTAL